MLKQNETTEILRIRKQIVTLRRENEKKLKYGAQNEAYMSRSAEKLVRGLCFNELGVGG